MIDENKLIEEIKERIEIYAEDYQAFRNYYGDRKTIDSAKWDECTEIIELIKKQPKEDVAPIVHGEWIGNTCSVCNLDWNKNMVNDGDDWGYFDPMPSYCPNCGANMD